MTTRLINRISLYLVMVFLTGVALPVQAALADAAGSVWSSFTKRIKPGLPKDAYAGTYRSPKMGDILIEQSGRELTLKTTRVEFKMTHWQLDTYLVEYEQWGLREFATYKINPEAVITSVELFGESFERVEEEQGED